MKRILFVCITLAVSVNVFAQHIVYKPKKSDFQTSILEGKAIGIMYEDARIVERKTKVNATFADITKAITETLEGAGAKVSAGEGAGIKVLQYEVFARGVVWIGVTKYEVVIDGEKYVLQGDASEGNVLGVKTAKSVQRKSFDKTNRELIKLFAEKL